MFLLAFPRRSTCPDAAPRRRSRRQRGFTLTEIMVALTISGLVFAAVTAQLVESARLSQRITGTLEHSRSARELVDLLAADIRSAQLLQLYPTFDDRATIARDGQTGNYLVLHSLDPRGVITRTVGYYVVALADSRGWAVHRHDSAAGDAAAGLLPAAGTRGTHRLVKRAERLAGAGTLFVCAGDRAVSIQGEFGPGASQSNRRAEFIRCTLSTRS